MSLADDQFNHAVAVMLTALDGFLPAGTPPSTVSLLSAAERPVGVGNWRGNVERGAAAVVGVRGGRVDARVRFDLRAASAEAAATAARDLQTAIRNALPATPDFLLLEPVGGAPAELINVDERWRQSVEYRVLFEYRYEDPEESGALIVRIPVELRGEQHEDDLVTRGLARWDREDAAPLVIRGPGPVGRLSVLAFTGGGAPGGQVMLRRTFDGAPPPTVHPDLPSFAAAVTSGTAAGRNAALLLANVQALLDLDPRPPPRPEVTLARLGDLPAPPPGGVPAAFQAYAIDALRDAWLETRGDRFEIAYQFAGGFPGGSNAVVYLRAGRGSAA